MRGSIDGKHARKYAQKVGKTEKSKQFDAFISSNLKGKNLKICDLCCGPGNTIELLRKQAREIVGVDVSDEMIKICKEKFRGDKKVRLQLSSVTETDLPNNHYDYVIIRMGLHHVKEKAKVLDESHRILKKKGKLIIVDKYVGNPVRFCWLFFLKMLKSGTAAFNEYIISKKNNDCLLSHEGFSILNEELIDNRKKKLGQIFMVVLEKK